MPLQRRTALVGRDSARILRLLGRSTAAALLCWAAAACLDKDLQNPNVPDGARALTTETVETLVAGAYGRWMRVHGYLGPTLFLSVAAGEHNSPWACCGMERFSRIPRVPTTNEAGTAYAQNLTLAWDVSYDAIADLQIGLEALEDGRVNFGEEGNLRARSYGKFVQGLAHGTVALLYDSGYVWDESLAFDSVALQGHDAVMEAAFGYFDEAIALAESGTFTVPASWMSREVTAETLAQLAHSWKARFRANVARTPVERRAVDWDAAVADVAAGIDRDWHLASGCSGNFCEEGLHYRLNPGWSMQDNWIAGMADQSGAYQVWIRTAVDYYPPRRLPFLILTPDTRWPQGPDEATQLENPGAYFVVNQDSDGSRVWSRPDRGTWRWSYYDPHREWIDPRDWDGVQDLPHVTVREMRALAAEAAYYRGDLAAVAGFVNETRTLHGLQATDAAGANADCVPRLPSGACGDLWEMFKWEKRLETQFRGPLRVGWYFDGRGWGDLLEGSVLQFPVPYSEMEVLGQPPYDYGGVGGEWGAPADAYVFFAQTSDVGAVQVAPADTIVAIGQVVRLGATALDTRGDPMSGRTFVWSSSDGRVATVDASGLVTAVAEGRAAIRAFTEWADGFATVTVIDSAVITPPTVHAVTVTPDTVTLTAPDQTVQLTATALDSTGGAIPGIAFAWSSSDEGVVTVDGAGLVTPLRNGTATVTASADSISGLATVVVHVPPTVVVSPAEMDLEGIGATYTFAATAWDASGQIPDPTVAWSSLNPAVATIDAAGTVTVVTSGQVTIAAEADGGVGYALLTVSVPGVSPVTAWQADSVERYDYNAVWGSSGTDVMVVGEHSPIRHSAGTSWNAMTSWDESLYDLWGTGSGHAFTVGAAGYIYRWDGVQWTSTPSGTGYGIIGVWGTSPADVFAVGSYGLVLHFDGDAWDWMIQPTSWETPSLTDVWGTSPSNVYAVGQDGTILHFDGSAWTTQQSGTSRRLRAVWGASPRDIFAVGDSGTVLHGNGVQWTTMTSGTNTSLMGVWGTSPTDVWAVGIGGVVRHYDGTSWTSVQVGTAESLFGVWGTSTGPVYVVGNRGTILRGVR